MQDRVLNDRYIILGEARQEGAVKVWAAFDQRLERKVVVKLIPATVAPSEASAAIERAVADVARLAHPNVVRLLDFGRTQSGAYVVFEHVSGQPLATFLASGITVEIRLVVDITAQIASALAYAHKQGVVHGCLNPGSIWITETSQVKVDFLPGEKLESLASVRSLRDDPTIGGYLAPEVGTGAEVTGAADTYSLAAIFLGLIGGDRPASDTAELTEILPEAPGDGGLEGLRRAAWAAMEKDVAKRAQSPSQLVVAWRAALPPLMPPGPKRAQRAQDETVIVRGPVRALGSPTGWKPDRALSAVILLVVALSLALAASGTYYFFLKPPPTVPGGGVPGGVTERGIMPGQTELKVYLPLVYREFNGVDSP